MGTKLKSSFDVARNHGTLTVNYPNPASLNVRLVCSWREHALSWAWILAKCISRSILRLKSFIFKSMTINLLQGIFRTAFITFISATLTPPETKLSVCFTLNKLARDCGNFGDGWSSRLHLFGTALSSIGRQQKVAGAPNRLHKQQLPPSLPFSLLQQHSPPVTLQHPE